MITAENSIRLNVALPLDMGKDWSLRAYPWIGTRIPTVGSTYVFKVTYSDDTTETLSSSVTGVLGLNSMAQTLNVTTTGAGSPTPVFTWAAPSAPPAGIYTYEMYLNGGSVNWNPNDLPSSTLSLLYNVDGDASSASLPSATTFNWQVTVRDANGNEATKQTTYSVP